MIEQEHRAAKRKWEIPNKKRRETLKSYTAKYD